jgi:hypothetical protein
VSAILEKGVRPLCLFFRYWKRGKFRLTRFPLNRVALQRRPSTGKAEALRGLKPAVRATSMRHDEPEDLRSLTRAAR